MNYGNNEQLQTGI